MLFLKFLLDNFKMYDIFSHFLSNVLNYGVNFKCLKYINDFKVILSQSINNSGGTIETLRKSLLLEPQKISRLHH